MTLTESEGAGTGLQVQGRYLLVTTVNSYIKIWDVSKREPRLHVHPVDLRERIPSMPATLRHVRLNRGGSMLSLCCGLGSDSGSSAGRNDSSRIYVLDFEGNRTCYFNFNSGRTDR